MTQKEQAQLHKNFYGSHVKADVVVVGNQHFHFEGENYAARAAKFCENMNHAHDKLSIQSAKTYFGSHCSGTVVVINEAPEHFQGDDHLNNAIEFVAALSLPLARTEYGVSTVCGKATA